MLITVATVLTVAVICAACGWWKVRRALIAERAARRLGEAALCRELADAASREARHQAVLDEASRLLRRQLLAHQVLAVADEVVDHAYATATNTNEHDWRGESDV